MYSARTVCNSIKSRPNSTNRTYNESWRSQLSNKPKINWLGWDGAKLAVKRIDKWNITIISLDDSNNIDNTMKISNIDVNEIDLLYYVSHYKILIHFSHCNMAFVTYYWCID